MIDYREEYYYQIFIILFIVTNFSKNRNGTNILTIKKLESIFFLIQNPKIFRKVLSNNELGKTKGYKETLYEQSTRISDYDNSDEIGLLVSKLCATNKLSFIETTEGNFLTSTRIEKEEINSIADNYLITNIDKFKKIASFTESKLIKSIMDA